MDQEAKDTLGRIEALLEDALGRIEALLEDIREILRSQQREPSEEEDAA
jgi:hypothetical protein